MSQPAPEPEPLVLVTVNVAVRTSAGSVPGPKMLPASEAGALVQMKYATYGSIEPVPEPTVRRFGSPPPPPAVREHSN